MGGCVCILHGVDNHPLHLGTPEGIGNSVKGARGDGLSIFAFVLNQRDQTEFWCSAYEFAEQHLKAVVAEAPFTENQRDRLFAQDRPRVLGSLCTTYIHSPAREDA